MDAGTPINSNRCITLTTDFGNSDVYVGVMKGVILGINPNAQIIDITHAIPPQDIHETAFTINAAYQYFPTGTIHVIVVDPGVGSSQEAMVYQTDNASFVCPNNGVLSYVLRELGSDGDAVILDNPAYHLPHVSNTFHGRDIFAPVAAHVSLGVALEELGTRMHEIVQLPMPTVQRSENRLTGQIIKIDRFGNVITNISEEMLATFLFPSMPLVEAISRLRLLSTPFQQAEQGNQFEIRVGNMCLKKLNNAYAESDAGTPLSIIGSFGLLEIAINLGSAETCLGLKRGDAVVIQRVV